jgi:hypothetical protein
LLASVILNLDWHKGDPEETSIYTNGNIGRSAVNDVLIDTVDTIWSKSSDLVLFGAILEEEVNVMLQRVECIREIKALIQDFRGVGVTPDVVLLWYVWEPHREPVNVPLVIGDRLHFATSNRDVAEIMVHVLGYLVLMATDDCISKPFEFCGDLPTIGPRTFDQHPQDVLFFGTLDRSVKRFDRLVSTRKCLQRQM